VHSRKLGLADLVDGVFNRLSDAVVAPRQQPVDAGTVFAGANRGDLDPSVQRRRLARLG